MKIFKSISWLAFLAVVILFILNQTLIAADWPQFRGPNRNGISTETGLLKSWPPEGPKLLWSVNDIGPGNSSAAIANNKLYITGMFDKQEYLMAFDLTGKMLWKQKYGEPWLRSYPDPRCTPTVDGDRVYVISGVGQLVCFDANTGAQKWAVHVVERFRGEYDRWGISECLLVDEKNVYCTPGGPDATVVALNKMTGTTVWVPIGVIDKSSYCNPIMIEYGGKKIISTVVEKSFIGIDCINGDLLWKETLKDFWPKNGSINPTSPVYHDGGIFITEGYNSGSAMFLLSDDGTKVTRKWVENTLDVHHGGVVLVDGYIYGANWKNNMTGNWVCLDWKTGKVMYEETWHCKGSIIAADGMLYIYDEKNGNVGLVKPNPQKFDLVSSFTITEGSGPFWAHISIANGVMYVRHGESLQAFSIKA